MTGGAGVRQSELPGPRGVHTLQLWLDRPGRLKPTPALCPYPTGHRTSRNGHAGAGPCRESGNGATRVRGSTWPITIIDLTLQAGACHDLPVPAGDRAFA